MALEAVVFPQNPFSYSAYNNMMGGNNNWSCDGLICLEKLDHDHHVHQEQYSSAGNDSFDFLENQTESTTTTTCSTTPYYGDHHHPNWNPSPSSMVPHFNDLHLSVGTVPSPDGTSTNKFQPFDLSTNEMIMPIACSTRPKRRRSRSRKNEEDIENQRMTHIAVERNRRKQMNEYLSVLRSLMPDSYVQRGDQASIIGGAINFVKELEQKVQFLGVQIKKRGSDSGVSDMPFSEFFSFPQYSTSSGASITTNHHDNSSVAMACTGETSSAGIADVEVTIVESHANLKIRSKRRPKQLLKMVSGLQSMRLTVLHLNVTTEDEIVLYSLSVKVEDDCKFTSVDEIATAVYQILARIQEETLMAN